MSGTSSSVTRSRPRMTGSLGSISRSVISRSSGHLSRVVRSRQLRWNFCSTLEDAGFEVLGVMSHRWPTGVAASTACLTWV